MAVGRKDKQLFERAQVLWVRAHNKELTVVKVTLIIFLLVTMVSGCSSVVSNAESYYQNIPRQPINWREYMTD
jgi:hypothetical protein